MDLISVIIPIYNVEEYLSRCLASVINNSYYNLEIICINDGSTDSSLNILEEYARNDERIIIYTKKNAGVSAARNDGIRIAKGEYILFIDPDDWVHPHYIEILYTFIKKSHADIIIGNCVKTEVSSVSYLNTDIENCHFKKLSIDAMFSDSATRHYSCGKIYRRLLINETRFCEDVGFAEDWIFNAEVWYMNSSINVFKVDEALYYYYQRPSSISHTVSCKTKLYSIVKLKEIINHWDNDNPFYEKYLTEIIKKSLALRYMCWLLRDDKAVIKTCNNLMSDCIKQARKMKSKGFFKFCVLYYMPTLYRLYRIKSDPTMLIFEKNQRKSRSI